MNCAAVNQFEYVDGQLRPSHAALFDDFMRESERAVEDGHPALDLAYGPHPRQALDLFRTTRTRKAAVAYFHGGYWQSRDKSGFRFIAPGLVADGFDVALVNYPLCPEAAVGEIVSAASASLTTLAELTGNAPLILVGHSAGAHIAIELGMAAPQLVAGILAISGVFDLAPLIPTALNERLGLDPASARAVSPVFRATSGAPPALFAVGARETQAFRDQSAAMAAAWAAAGNQTGQITVAQADHFSILNELSREDGVLRRAIRCSSWF